MDKNRIIYYEDELNDDFSDKKIVPRVIDENYKYIHKNPIWNAFCYIIQNIISVPIKFLYSKITLRTKYVGKEKLKKYRKKGYFVYGNHTQIFSDTFLTSNAIFPKRNFFIVSAENVSMKFLGNIIQLFGAIPIPNKLNGMSNFINAVNEKIKKGYSVTIFPEAHIWPYYTKIRPFESVSFKYPVKLDAPVFCMTNTYQKYKDSFRLVCYIDGPFFADKSLNLKEQKQKLRDEVYNTMVERSKNSNFEYIKYVKKEDANNGR